MVGNLDILNSLAWAEPAGADPGFVERGAQRLPRAPHARRFLEGPV